MMCCLPSVLYRHETMVSREDKELLLGQRGAILWFTGQSNKPGVNGEPFYW